MNYQQILYEIDGAVATITLNRPIRMNALTKIMEAELRSAIEAAGRDASVKVIILVGAGKAFCAGMDMDGARSLAARGHQGGEMDAAL
jgi:enoyl-CoA hydratase/carnithine racemase